MGVKPQIMGDFNTAIRLLESLDSCYDDFDSHNAHKRCLRLFAGCMDRRARLSQLGNNSQLEDLESDELWLLNIDFYVAQALNLTSVELSDRSVDHRISITKVTIRKYLDFLIALEQYGIRVLHGQKLKSLFPNGYHYLYNLKQLADDNEFRETIDFSASKLPEEVQQMEKIIKQYNGFLFCDSSAVRDLQIRRLSYHAKLAWLAIISGTEELICWGNVLGSRVNTDLILREDEFPSIQRVPHSYLAALLGPYRFLPDLSPRLRCSSPTNENFSGPGKTCKEIGLRGDVARLAFGTNRILPTAEAVDILEKNMVANWGVNCGTSE